VKDEVSENWSANWGMRIFAKENLRAAVTCETLLSGLQKLKERTNILYISLKRVSNQRDFHTKIITKYRLFKSDV